MAVIPGLDERYMAGTDLSPYFVDKDSGAPLAGGKIYFYRDVQRLVPKLVYTLTGPNNLGAYEYTALPNPITLSGAGTIDDLTGNNVPLYYFPYDADDNLDLYYIVVESATGVEQFTRQAWPSLAGSEDPLNDNGVQTNQISNPQFIAFNYDNANFITVSFIGASSGFIEIAPDWTLFYQHIDSGDITATLVPVAGGSHSPTNPPFYLQITPGVNLSSVILIQRLRNTPAIWATASDDAGYVSAGLLLGANTGVTVNYRPSNGAATTLLAANNATANFNYFTNSVVIPLSTSVNTGDTGYVSIEIVLSPTNISRLSSVQVVSTGGAGEVIPFIQESGNRQIDHLFHVYKANLLARALKSYLVGWDFALNPAQFGGRIQAASGGANSSKYTWDQTILYQNAASAFNVATTTTGSYRLECVAGSPAQFALIQYLDTQEAQLLLHAPLSASIVAGVSMAAGLNLRVSLWYTTDANLPDINAGQSIISSLGANGQPTSFNGTWNEVAANSNAPMQALFPTGTQDSLRSISFNYWVPTGAPAPATVATYFAMVVSSAPIEVGGVVEFQSISLVRGTFGTDPMPQTTQEVLADCQRYYQKTYDAGVLPGTAATYVGMKASIQGWVSYDTELNKFYNGRAAAFEIAFKNTLRVIPTLSFYSPVTGTAARVSYNYVSSDSFPLSDDAPLTTPTGAFGSSSTANAIRGVNIFGMGLTGLASSPPYITYHYTADARLGVL